jgi:acyl carrier protein
MEPIMTTLQSELVQVLQAELGAELHGITPPTPLRDLADSLQWLALFDALEDAFGSTISLEQGIGLRSIGDLMRVLAPAAVA